MSMLNFEKAEYVSEANPVAAEPEIVFAPVDHHTAFARALLFGLCGAVLGAIIYAVVGLWIQIGFVAILVGVLVGNGMMNGSGGVGGRKYQIASLLLTYFAVNFALILDVVWIWSRKGLDLGSVFAHHWFALILFLLGGPFMLLFSSAADGLFCMLMLFFGMRAAWRVTKGGQNYFRLRPYDPHRPLNLRD